MQGFVLIVSVSLAVELTVPVVSCPWQSYRRLVPWRVLAAYMSVKARFTLVAGQNRLYTALGMAIRGFLADHLVGSSTCWNLDQQGP